MQINRYLVADLQKRGLWDQQMISELKKAEGSVQPIDRIPQDLKEVYRTAWEIPQRALIDMAADRGAFVDQSQSLNLFMETPTIGKLSSMYLHAWKKGLKTTYYLRSRAATRINQTTSGGSDPHLHRFRSCGLQPGESRIMRGMRLMALAESFPLVGEEHSRRAPSEDRPALETSSTPGSI